MCDFYYWHARPDFNVSVSWPLNESKSILKITDHGSITTKTIRIRMYHLRDCALKSKNRDNRSSLLLRNQDDRGSIQSCHHDRSSVHLGRHVNRGIVQLCHHHQNKSTVHFRKHDNRVSYSNTIMTIKVVHIYAIVTIELSYGHPIMEIKVVYIYAIMTIEVL